MNFLQMSFAGVALWGDPLSLEHALRSAVILTVFILLLGTSVAVRLCGIKFLKIFPAEHPGPLVPPERCDQLVLGEQFGNFLNTFDNNFLRVK